MWASFSSIGQCIGGLTVDQNQSKQVDSEGKSVETNDKTNSFDLELQINKYRVLRSCDGDHLIQRVPGGTDRTEGMARISWINQMGPQRLKFQVS